MAATDTTRSDAVQHLLEYLIDLLEETRELMGTVATDLREARVAIFEPSPDRPESSVNGRRPGRRTAEPTRWQRRCCRAW